MRLLVVTAVAAEQDSVATGVRSARGGRRHTGAAGQALPGGREALRIPFGGTACADVLAAGVGPAAAAAGTAAALVAAEWADTPYDFVVSAGIGGGFAPASPVGSVAVAETIVAADLGADTADGFMQVAGLGFGVSEHRPPAALSRAVAQALGASYGPVLTVSTVTGSAERAAELAARHPGAVAEAMEGFGVAEAAAAHGVPVLEIRAVSNAVGPRDRAAWRIGDALVALTEAFEKLPAVLDVDLEGEGRP